MNKKFIAIEVCTNDKGSYIQGWNGSPLRDIRDEAVADARTKATKSVGETFGVFELTGTVKHPIPDLDVTPVT